MSERDKFLTEAMGECWHEWEGHVSDYKRCMKCHKDGGYPEGFRVRLINNNFSIWEGFGKLWEFCQKQEWWNDFCLHHKDSDNMKVAIVVMSSNYLHEDIINPDRFADAVYEYLKSKEDWK